MDVVLLSHFLARILRTPTPNVVDHDLRDPYSVFLSLLPGPHTPQTVLDIIPKSLTPQDGLATTIYSRFGNNNFTVHSHMNTIGHGVFPLASRLFNHSCVPNAAPRYVLTSAQPVIMEVVALENINLGEEVRQCRYLRRQSLIISEDLRALLGSSSNSIETSGL